jgi:hypothetical protein
MTDKSKEGLMIETVVIIAIVIVVLFGGLLAFAAMKPNTFSVRRATTIKAPAATIFANIADFRRWSAWSPWEKLDPALKRTYSGAADGKGAVYTWEGNGNVGAGRMEITDTSPASRVTIRLDFFRPFKGTNTAEFNLTPAGDATDVSWSMHGPLHFIPKVMSVFISMDRMIGKSFEEGLANLKAAAEK